MTRSRCDALVLFGATGDLAHKKIFPAIYRLEQRGQLSVPVIGVALSGWSPEDLRNRFQESVAAAEREPDPDLLRRLA